MGHRSPNRAAFRPRRRQSRARCENPASNCAWRSKCSKSGRAMKRWTVDQGGDAMLRQMFALAPVVATGPAVPPATAQDKPLKKTRIVAATAVLDVTYPQLTLPLTLGYW